MQYMQPSDLMSFSASAYHPPRLYAEPDHETYSAIPSLRPMETDIHGSVLHAGRQQHAKQENAASHSQPLEGHHKAFSLRRGPTVTTTTGREPSAYESHGAYDGAAGDRARSRGFAIGFRTPGRILGSSIIPSLSSGIFLLVVILETLAVIGLVVSVFAIVEMRTEKLTQDAKTVPVFLSLFVFGMLFFVILAVDAFRLHNTIQIVGCVVYNVALLVTAALEVAQVRSALFNQDHVGLGVPCPYNQRRHCGAVATLYPAVKPQLIATPVIIGIAQIPLTWLTFKLWQDFGWQIYKKIGADLMQRRRMLVYQVWVVMLKLVWVVGTAFCIAFLILVSDRSDAEFGLTIAALPIALAALLLSAFAARREILSLMLPCILLMATGVVYFAYKLSRIYASSTKERYRTVRLTLTFFSILAILSLLATIVLAIWCTVNFNKGLKEAHESMGLFEQFSRRRAPCPMALDGADLADTSYPAEELSGSAAAPRVLINSPPEDGYDQHLSTITSAITHPHRLPAAG